MASHKLLLDTDILIDYLRGYEGAVKYLEGLTAPLAISAMTITELYAGVKGVAEEDALGRFLQVFEIIPIDHQLAKQGGLFRRDFGKSHGTGLADALIAATAILHHATLVTFNTKHFPMVNSVLMPYSKK